MTFGEQCTLLSAASILGSIACNGLMELDILELPTKFFFVSSQEKRLHPDVKGIAAQNELVRVFINVICHVSALRDLCSPLVANGGS